MRNIARLLQLPPHHPGNNSARIGGLCGESSHVCAIFQDGYHICYFFYFRHPVGDVNNSAAFLFQPADNGKQGGRFPVGDRGGGFIQY